MNIFQLSVISLIGIYPRETLAFIHQETYEEMFRETVFIIATLLQTGNIPTLHHLQNI